MILLVFYLPTASYRPYYHIDAEANVFTAWSIAQNGTPYLDEWRHVVSPELFSRSNQLIEGRGRPVSKYPPGAALLAAPFYLFSPELGEVTAEYHDSQDRSRFSTYPVPSLAPAAVAASLSTALGVAAIGVMCRRRIGAEPAVIAALTLGLGTTLWAISANALWQHGPVVMWLGLGLLAIDSKRLTLAGFAFGLAIITRPQVAVAIGCLGSYLAVRNRSTHPLLKIGVPSVLGLAAYLAYNVAIFAEPIPRMAAGYWIDNSVGASFGLTEALWRTLLDPTRGVLIWSPVVWLALPRVRTAWRSADPLVRGAALAGLAYMLIQLRGNVWNGGGGFYAYRYAIEFVFLLSPLLAVSTAGWVLHAPALRSRLLGVFIAVTIGIQLAGAIIY